MINNLGALGNIEVYLFLPDRNVKYQRSLEEMIGLVPTSTLRNVWESNVIGQEISFDASLFTRRLNDQEEILIQYLIGNNLLTIILLQNKIIVRISFKPWDEIENQLIQLIDYLLKEYLLLVLGFELDFDYESENLHQTLQSLVDQPTNYPFITKNRVGELTESLAQENQLTILNLLKEKANLVLSKIICPH